MADMEGRPRGAWAIVAVLLAAAALAACGGEPPAEATRPVLVVHPQGGAEGAMLAFAGEVRAREESPLAFRVGGKLVRRLVDVGDRVDEGELLAEIDPGDLALQENAARARLAAAEGQLRLAKADRDRFEALAEDQLVSRSARDAQEAAHAAALGQARAARAELEAARNQVAYSQLRAPADGVVAERHAEAGQVVAAGQPVFTLAADGPREVAIALPESRIDAFAVGRAAEVELWSSPGQRLPARVREIAPAADPRTRTFATRVALQPGANADVELGQSARVHFRPLDGEATQLTVPLAALQRDDAGGAAVWVVDPESHALHLQPVQAGVYGEDRVPVSGLSADDWIVAAGGHLLREGQVVSPLDRDNRPLPSATAKKQ